MVQHSWGAERLGTEITYSAGLELLILGKKAVCRECARHVTRRYTRQGMASLLPPGKKRGRLAPWKRQRVHQH